MSRRNREKRAAKQKNRRGEAGQRERVRFDREPDRAQLLGHLVVALSEAATCRCDRVAQHAAELLEEFSAAAHELDVAADIAMNEAIRAAWEHGWSPSDLHEITRRKLEPAAVGYLDQAIIRESGRYAVATLHPRWRADLAAIAATVDRGSAGSNVNSPEALTVVLKVLTLLGSLPVLEPLLPLPGAHRHTAAAVSAVDEKALGRVRALLAKAEDTEFPEEAEILSAKAQELMSRYSLQEAVVHHERGEVPVAAARRMWIENPYAVAKTTLVQAVAQANRCRVVWAERLGFVTVIGSETDLNLVELLTTSLLVQANRAMLRAGRQVSGRGQSRTRSFRQSFLVAYATRIGERLDETRASVTAEAEHDARLLPVLAAGNRAADDLTNRLFPSMTQRPVSVSNGAGWVAGRAAADLAHLNVRDEIAG
ncbi:DUF2786 domain-containing protein [Mycobacterium branderi]|nr:DUF2786 domain-containing protein [Mycobacterium branderi]MCV7235017.1 DUF2786 domain-containing protein [Mycobacterium branderi]ORA36691.1 hypothetical protein BST20_15435 [Mycobacterium branderi]